MKRLTAGLAALAIAATALVAAPAPARAGNDDVLKFLLGAAAIGLILNEANKRQQPVARAATVAPRHSPRPPSRLKAVPASCLFDIEGRYGPRPVVGERCVRRWDARADLPAACAFDLRPGPRERTVYGLRCLRDRGYRIVQG
jgi:hypothetical protein